MNQFPGFQGNEPRTGPAAGYYSDSPETDPVGPSSGTNWVNRGGSWVNGPSNGRVADRDKINTRYQDDDLGFRLARTSH